MYTCPTPNFNETDYEISKKKNSLADNKVYDVYKWTFPEKSDRDRHILQSHGSHFQISDKVSDKIDTD